MTLGHRIKWNYKKGYKSSVFALTSNSINIFKARLIELAIVFLPCPQYVQILFKGVNISEQRIVKWTLINRALVSFTAVEVDKTSDLSIDILVLPWKYLY